MEHIIQQLALDLGKNILKKAVKKENIDLDMLCNEIAEECRSTARHMLEAIIDSWNEEIRQNKSERKEAGLVIQQRNRVRNQVTSLGLLEWSRDYYFDKKNVRYVYPLDMLLNVQKYDRISRSVSAELINQATMVSYARSSDIVTGGTVSRQSVRNKLLKLNVPEAEISEGKKAVRELHVYADEDHAHLQKERKEQGKKGQYIPLVTVTEGTEASGSRRNKTINPVRFVDEGFSGKNLWKTVEGFIGMAYDPDKIEKIWVHGDGGPWIKNGLDNFRQCIHVMDGYHLKKEIRKISKAYPKRNVSIVIENALKNNDRSRADRFLQDIMTSEEDDDRLDAVKKFGTYLLGHWEENRRRITEDIPGSCTEGQVSHVLSERFSRDPLGWSKAALGKLTGARVSLINGRAIRGSDFDCREVSQTYAEYSDLLIRKQCEGAIDWSIFDGEPDVYDAAAGTRYVINSLGEIRSLIN